MSTAHVESERDFRVPSGYKKCRYTNRWDMPHSCQSPSVADMKRIPEGRFSGKPNWWAYCAKHLRGYNREVRDGRVWWIGSPEDASVPR
jgi:hypothetical protein